MKKISLRKFEIISTIFAITLGTILHFTYKWSGNNPIVGIFSAVNESTWEHLKILFFPMLITTIIGSLYYKNISNYLCSKVKGIILAMMLIVVLFYTYKGILGTSIAFINILIFIIAIIAGEIFTYKKIKLNSYCNNLIFKIVLIILSISFILFTFKTPHIGIFKNPVDETYGINQ